MNLMRSGYPGRQFPPFGAGLPLSWISDAFLHPKGFTKLNVGLSFRVVSTDRFFGGQVFGRVW